MATPRERGRVSVDDIAHDEQLEIVRGEIVRKASPTMMHGMVHYALGTALAGYHGAPGPGRPGGWVFGNEVTIAFDPHEEVYRPDTAGWRIERAPDPCATGAVTVAPDWVLEVLSPSTMNNDLGDKLHIYHRAHVGHYWLAHPHPTKQLLQVYRWHEQGYLLVLTAKTGDVVRAEPFDALELNIARILAWPAGTTTARP